MRLRLENVRTRVLSLSADEEQWLFDYLSIEAPRGFYAEDESNRLRFYNPKWSSFPAGFTAKVLKGAQKQGYTCQVKDIRRRPVSPTDADLGWLRDYQLDAVLTAIRKTRGIIKSPTASGKTEMMAGIVKRLPCRWLLIAHRTNLLEQARATIKKRTGLHVGLVGDGEWTPSNITAATFQTLSAGIRRKDRQVINLLKSVDGFIVDEAHVLPAQSFRKVVARCSNAYFRFGVSATPMAQDAYRAMIVSGCLGRVFKTIPVQELIKLGHVSDPQIYMVRIRQRGFSKKAWRPTYDGYIKGSRIRNFAAARAVQILPAPAIVFVNELDHGETLTRMLTDMGITTEFVHGDFTTSARMDVVGDLQSGELDCIVATNVFQAGMDASEIRTMVNAGAMSSAVQTLQRLGRAMRIAEDGTKKCWVVDFMDEGNRYVVEHAETRKQIYLDEGHRVTVIDDVEQLHDAV